MSVHIPESGAASADTIAELEDRYGCLPADFRHFLAQHDGARPSNSVLPLTSGSANIREFVPASEILELAGSVDGFSPENIPIARDDSGNLLYISLNDGHIYFWDHEVEGPDEKVSDSFADFIAKLQPYDAFAVKLDPSQVQSVWVNPDFKPEF